MIRKPIIPIIILVIYTFVSYGYIYGKNEYCDPQKIIINDDYSYIYDKNEDSKNTVLQMAFYGGNSYDPSELKGISQLAVRMFIQISGRDDAKNMVTENSKCYIRVKNDYIIITIECISEYFDEAVKIYFKTIAKPDITGLRVNYLKRRLEQMQKSVKEDYGSVLNESIMDAFFKGSGYDGAVYGNNESIKNIKRKSISAYHKDTISISNMVLSVSSDLKTKHISKVLKKNLKYFSKGTKKINKEFKPLIIKTDQIRRELKGDLNTVVYAFPLRFKNNKINKKDFIFGKMLETFLGRGIGAYLWDLRTKENLTYSINSKAVFFKPFGYLYFSIRTEKKNIEKTLELYKVLTDNLIKGVNKGDFNSIITYTSSSFFRLNELKRALSYNLAFFEVIGLGFEFYKEFFSEIKKITINEFNEYLKNTLAQPNRLPVILGRK